VTGQQDPPPPAVLPHEAKTWDTVKAAARAGAAFSNGFEWESWAGEHCWVCVRDRVTAEGCVITGLAMLEQVTPAEWVETHPYALADRYTCTDFVRSSDVPPGPARLEVGPMTMVMPPREEPT
jgi:hypothetical protein